MYDHEKSDPAIVAAKPSNKAGQPAAELVEPRAGAEGNVNQQSTGRAQYRGPVSQALKRIRQAARQRKKEKFTTLLHHVSTDHLEEAFFELKKNAAPGVDGLTCRDSRERERSEETGRTWAWLTALKWVIGYGYYLHRAVYWVIGLVILGAIVLRVSGEGPRNGMPFGLAYSFDILLPIIKLRDWHYQIDLKTWARYYFYGHKIMGFVLASFLIAGLSGLTK